MCLSSERPATSRFNPTVIRHNRGHTIKALHLLGWEANMRMREVVREMVRHEQQP